MQKLLLALKGISTSALLAILLSWPLAANQVAVLLDVGAKTVVIGTGLVVMLFRRELGTKMMKYICTFMLLALPALAQTWGGRVNAG